MLYKLYENSVEEIDFKNIFMNCLLEDRFFKELIKNEIDLEILYQNYLNKTANLSLDNNLECLRLNSHIFIHNYFFENTLCLILLNKEHSHNFEHLSKTISENFRNIHDHDLLYNVHKDVIKYTMTHLLAPVSNFIAHCNHMKSNSFYTSQKNYIELDLSNMQSGLYRTETVKNFEKLK